MSRLARLPGAAIRMLAKFFPFRTQAKALDLCCRLVQWGVLGYQLTITYRGHRVFLERHDWGGARIRVSFALHGQWYHEMFEQRMVDDLLDSASHWTVVDAGASYGMYSLLAASHSSVAKVVAIEASPTTHEYLRRTVVYNELSSRIEVLNAGVSSTSGIPLTVVAMRSSEWNKVVAASGSGGTAGRVVSVTVDDVLARVAVSERSPVFIKMDIEGHEPVAFNGMAKLFGGQAPYAILFEFHVGLLGESSYEFADYIFSIANTRVYLLDAVQGKAHLLDRLLMGQHIDTASHASHPFNLFNLLIVSQSLAWQPPAT